MREYKFRGKNKNTGKWVYGYYFKDFNGKSYIINTLQKMQNADTSNVWIEVIEETIGQYTGLKDKNGKETYEGDVVLIDAYTYTEPEFSEEYLVEYNELLGMWELKNLEDNKDIKTFEDLNGWYKLDIKLLGNKWDNPELLEEGE